MKKGTDNFSHCQYFEFSMVDHKPVMDQVHDLQALVNRLKDLKVKIFESLQVGAIISELPSTGVIIKKIIA